MVPAPGHQDRLSTGRRAQDEARVTPPVREAIATRRRPSGRSPAPCGGSEHRR
ncbi:hypothetical protein STXM2123_4938 [Streptomyces sp. F-3]|nr:hypothetical protein STXM2123_4938 [Streptomyces sp. F-3]